MRVPPHLLGFPSPQIFLKSVSDVLPAKEYSSFVRLATQQLPPVTSLLSLALLFQYSQRFVVAMAMRPERYYRRFSISKGAKSRKIDAPKIALKAIQTWFGHYVARAISYDECVHGFVPGRSAVSAAQIHCQAKWVLSFDIKDFFPSIDEDQVIRILGRLGYSAPATRLLARLFTLDGSLPQGSPVSPVLANLAFARTDRRLSGLARRYDLAYTRYADDLTFSSRDSWVNTGLRAEIERLIRDDDWVLAARKTRLVTTPRRMEVLGLVVNGNRPRLSKAIRNRVRLMRHLLAQGAVSELNQARFRGYLAYANSVEGVSGS